LLASKSVTMMIEFTRAKAFGVASEELTLLPTGF